MIAEERVTQQNNCMSYMCPEGDFKDKSRNMK